jgi:uncharacterized membrane protein
LRERLARLAPLADALAGAGLLLASGGAAGLALATHALVPDGSAFVLENRAPAAVRAGLLASALGAALALAAAPVLAWLAGRSSAARLRATGARLCPLLPAGLAGLLLGPATWSQARLAHLLGCALLAALAVACLRARALAEPLGCERRLAAALAPRLAPLARALAGRRALPLLVVVAAAAGYAAWFSRLTLEAHWNGHTRAYDLAIFDNLMWNLVHGGDFLVSTPAGGGEHSHFGRHATLLAYALAPFYALRQSAENLLVLQALLLGFAAVPLFGFARRQLGPWGACALALAYLLYPPLHGSNLYDFHFLTISPFFVLCVAHALETRSRAWLALSTGLALACREDVALLVAVLGAHHVLASRRTTAGLVLAALGGAWFVATKFVLMPLASTGGIYSDIYQGLVPEGASGFGAVLQTLLVNPGFVLGTLLTATKLEYALLILAPLAFVPLRRASGAVFLLPGVLFTLLSTDYPPTVSIGFQYTAFWTPLLFLAAALLLREDAFSGASAHAARAGWLGAFALLALVCSVQYGAIFQQRTASGGFHDPFPFETTPLDLERRRLRAEVLRALPPDARVAASEAVAPHVSNRAVAYTLREGVRDAEYVVFAWVPEAPGEHAIVRALLLSGRFGVLASNPYYALLRRGGPTALNARLAERLFVPAPTAP